MKFHSNCFLSLILTYALRSEVIASPDTEIQRQDKAKLRRPLQSQQSRSLNTNESRVLLRVEDRVLPHKSDQRALSTEANRFKIAQIGSDIDGENYYDFAGGSVTMSANGEFVAVGAYGASGYSGHVRIFRLDSSTRTWVKHGQTIIGESGCDYSGKSISLSGDGTRIAIGAPNNTNYYGHTRVYEFDPETELWIQLGTDIDGERKDGESGYYVALSGDGRRLAVGSPKSSTITGHVAIYEFTNGTWMQLGPIIAGDQYYSSLGNSLALSDNGDRIVIGSRFDPQGEVRLVGAVGVFEYVAGEWLKLGSELTGDSYYDIFGHTVDISADGSRIVIGSPNEDYEGVPNVGMAQVREYDSVQQEWLLVGNIIMGDKYYQGLGHSVSINGDGNRIVVGSERCDDGDKNAGCTWVFDYDPVSKDWWQIGKTIYGEFRGDASGRSVAISASGDHIAIGAPLNPGNGDYYNGHTRVYEIEDAVATSQPSLMPSAKPSSTAQQTLSPVSSPSPSQVRSQAPSSSPSESNPCAPNRRLLSIEITTDSHGAEDNWFVVKRYQQKTGSFSLRVFRRTSLQSSTTMVYEKCLPVNACYIFRMMDRARDGMCCEHGNGRFKVTWDGKLIKDSRKRFTNGKQRKSPPFGDKCDDVILVQDLMRDTISHDLTYYDP